MEEQIDYDAKWTMVIESVSNNKKELTLTNADCNAPIRKGNTFIYGNVGGKDIDVQLTYAASKDCKGALEISAVIENNEEDWMVKIWNYPALKGFKTGKDDVFMLPMGTGWQLPLKAVASVPESGEKAPKPWSWNAKTGNYECVKSYPSKHCSMQWGLLRTGEECVYFASYDDKFSSKNMETSYNPATAEALINFRHKMTCFPGTTAEVPPMVVRKYKGDWYEAADSYREWFHAKRQCLERPEWLRNNTGWLLAILKQQNDEVIVPYEEIGGILTDAAIERGLDILGLFGRGIGGHDRYYPDYSPDPKLGGEEALRKGIAKAKERGMRVVLYTNGQLLDQDCPWFWPDTGQFITVQRKTGVLESQTWHKYKDAPARVHGLACHSCQTWRDIMLRLAMQAYDLGADGLLYDQLSCSDPKYCYNPDHGHPVPAIVYENDLNANINFIQQEMAKIDPEFVVMTEGLVDAHMNVVDMFHGSSPAAVLPSKGDFIKRFKDEERSYHFFYELYRYTFPEVISTIRIANASNTRFILNYGLAYGMRNEMELRYASDRKYVEKNLIPSEEDYGNVLGAPSVKLMEEAGDPLEAEKYHRQVLTFQKNRSDLLMNGCFRAGNGVELEASSDLVMANAFASADGSKVGVLVWNMSEEPVSYKVAYPGYTQKGVESPDKDQVNPGDALDPQSVHFVMFEK